jgi:hypothetical protein
LTSKSPKTSQNPPPEDSTIKHILEKIKLMRQEFEELLFLKHAADTLKDFRKRLLKEKWD